MNGLVYDVFYLSISSSLVPPLMKFINIPEIIKKIMICLQDRPSKPILIKRINQQWIRRFSMTSIKTNSMSQDLPIFTSSISFILPAFMYLFNQEQLCLHLLAFFLCIGQKRGIYQDIRKGQLQELIYLMMLWGS